MRIATGSDHAGFPLKEEVNVFLRRLRQQVLDVGTHDTEPVDYPDYAEAVALAVQKGRTDRGIIICGSGVGASVAGVRLDVLTFGNHQLVTLPTAPSLQRQTGV